MVQAATPGDLGLPCSPKQALALYQHLFRGPAGLGQLRAALRQVREGQACPPGLELPTVLLEMERGRRAQEQLLWDLELLTGAGLGLFWPPRVQVGGLRDQARRVWSQHSEARGGMGVDSRQPMSESSGCSSPQAGDTLSQHHRFLEGCFSRETCALHGATRSDQGPAAFLVSFRSPGSSWGSPSAAPIWLPHSPWSSSQDLCRGQAAGRSSAPDLGEARSDTAPRWESPGAPAEPTPGCLQELDTTTRSSFGEPGNSEFKNLALKEERGQATPVTHRPLPLVSRSPQGSKIPQQATGYSGPPEPQDSTQRLDWSLSQDRTELQKLLGIETPQGQGEEAPQGESKEAPRTQTEAANQGQGGEVTQALGQQVFGGLGWETPQGENKDALQDPKGNCLECPRKETPQSQEVKDLPSSGGRSWISQAWEVAQKEAPTHPREEGDSWGTLGDFCESLGEQIWQSGRREGPGPRGRDVQLTQDKTQGQRQDKALAVGEKRAGQEGALAPLRLQKSSAQLQLPNAGAEMLWALSTPYSEQQECPTALPGQPGLVRNPYGLQDPGGGPGPTEQQMGESRGPRAAGSVRFPGPPEEQRSAAEGPKASKTAWPGPPDKEKASAGLSAAQRESALQRLLELQGAARRRRWQDREQQRLWVLDRLRIARNRLCRVHPLGPPPSPAQLQPQDMEGQQRALLEHLYQVHPERTGRLRAPGARNTQNFQQLLRPPGAEEQVPGK